MKKSFLFIAFLLCMNIVRGQDKPENRYDFWVGTWDLTWSDANGEIERGKNIIAKTLDGKVIQENFSATEGAQKGYKGTSISVYNPQTSTWYQTWMDNQQSNINFTGGFVDDNPSFITTPQNINGKIVISRMVFKNFSKDSFTWDWEFSNDGGKTWQLNWKINYKRAK